MFCSCTEARRCGHSPAAAAPPLPPPPPLLLWWLPWPPCRLLRPLLRRPITRVQERRETQRTAAGANENQVQVREERSDASSEMSTSIRKRFALEFAVGNSQQTTQHTKHTGFLRNVGNCRTLDTARIPPYKAIHIRQTQRAGNRKSHSLRGSSPLNASRIGGRGASRCDRVVSTSTHGRQLAAGQRRDDGCAKHSLDRR